MELRHTGGQKLQVNDPWTLQYQKLTERKLVTRKFKKKKKKKNVVSLPDLTDLEGRWTNLDLKSEAYIGAVRQV